MKDGISPNEYVCAKHSENQKVNISKEVVAGRRKQFPEACMLSDYQVESAHVTALAITSVADGSQTGPVYVPMPTGSGKTTGAIWGIVDVARKNPDRKICFLTPYVEAVERVHAALVSHLGGTQVGFYHSKAGANKNAELSKPVVVLTHEFIKHNKDSPVVSRLSARICAANRWWCCRITTALWLPAQKRPKRWALAICSPFMKWKTH